MWFQSAVSVRVLISFFLSGGLFILLMSVPLPGNEVSYMTDPTLHQEIRQDIYVLTALIAFIHASRNNSDDFGAAVGAALFGPIYITMVAILWTWVKFFPPKVEKRGSEDMEQYVQNIGKPVRKKSNKPFKSTSKVNTVSAVVINPHTNKPAYTFEEDDSVVDAQICRNVED